MSEGTTAPPVKHRPGIVRLTASNVKRLKAVEIRPDGSPLVKVSGRNGQGKSSLLDAIAWTLGGKREFPRQPVRKGEEKATIVLETEDYLVTRVITADGATTLEVRDARKPSVFRSPQDLLNSLLGDLSFDPLAFARLSEKEQRLLLMRVLGLDFAAVDKERQQVFDARTAENRDVRQLQARVDAAQEHGGVPAAEVSLAGLSSELREADAAHQAADGAERAVLQAEGQVKTAIDQIEDLKQQHERLMAQAAELDARIKRGIGEVLPEYKRRRDEAEQKAKAFRDSVPDREAIRRRLVEAEGINASVRANAQRAALIEQLGAARKRADGMTADIERIDAEKRKAIETAAYPLPGLSVDENGLLLNGMPFDQASQAEQLRASVAIGLALNPKLRVLLVRDGSLLDAQSMQLLSDTAKEAGAQVWLELVANDGEGVGIVIEDGAVVASPVAEAAAEVSP